MLIRHEIALIRFDKGGHQIGCAIRTRKRDESSSRRRPYRKGNIGQSETHSLLVSEKAA
jgi:hypothetical protein